MFESMIERVARLIAEQRGDFRLAVPNKGFTQTSVTGGASAKRDTNWERHSSDARAILLALREPTEAMRHAQGSTVKGEQGRIDSALHEFDADAVWQAMIDAALAEKAGERD